MPRFLETAGRRLEHAWWGSASATGTPIVLLHEGLGSVTGWRDWPEAVAARTARRVMAYSRPGHGWSAAPRRPRTPSFMYDQARLLPAVLAASGVDRAILLGHSDGGSIALIAAAGHPDLVDALILLAPHVFVEDLSLASIEAAVVRFDTTDMRERLSRHHADVDRAFHQWADIWLDPAFRDWNIESVMPQVRCPLLLIQGEQDAYGTVAQVEAIARRVPGPVDRLMLKDCGHHPHKDQREAVLAAIEEFVRTRCRAADAEPVDSLGRSEREHRKAPAGRPTTKPP
ncbi:MAG: alpha/beta fold hydrolase [Acidobacteriota bacterium]